MKRKSFQVRDELRSFFENDKILTEEMFGQLARRFLNDAFDSLKAGDKDEEVLAQTIDKFSKLLDVYVFGKRKMFWQEFKRLYDAGVIKQAAFIDYLIVLYP